MDPNLEFLSAFNVSEKDPIHLYFSTTEPLAFSAASRPLSLRMRPTIENPDYRSMRDLRRCVMCGKGSQMLQGGPYEVVVVENITSNEKYPSRIMQDNIRYNEQVQKTPRSQVWCLVLGSFYKITPFKIISI